MTTKARKQQKAKGYAVRYQRDADGWWVATVRGVAAQTQGRTIEQARERIREAIAALVDVDIARVAIDRETVRLDARAQRALADAKRATERARKQAAQAEVAMRQAANALVGEGLSFRDAGELLGVSRQRVHQIVEGARGRAA